MFQDGSHEIIWPPTTLAQCVHSSPQQHASVQAHCVQSIMVQNKLGREKPARKSMCLDSSVRSKFVHYNTRRNQLPSCGAYHSVPTAVDAHCWEMRQFWPEDKHRQSIWIRTMHVTKQNWLNLSNAWLIPCASLSTVSHTINFLFKVLFIFPPGYLFTISLVAIFSIRRSLPPILGCIPKKTEW